MDPNLLVDAFSGHLLVSGVVKASLLVAVAFGIIQAARSLSAAHRHMVWTLAFGALLVLPVLAVWLPERPLEVPLLRAEETRLAMPQSTTGPDGLPLVSEERETDPSGAASMERAEKPAVGTYDVAAPVSGLTPSVPALLVILWGTGVLVVMLRGVLARLGRRFLASRATPANDVDWTALLFRLRKELGVGRPVRLLFSPYRIMPMTWGWRRPVVLLPAEANDWSAGRRRLVLAHELAHVRRCDALTLLLAEGVRALYWFNPMIWLAERALREEGERACDDRVLRAGVRPSDYATELVTLAGRFRSTGGTSFAAMAMATPSRLESRVIAILDPRKSRSVPGSALRLLSTVVAALGIALLASCTPVPVSAQSVPPAPQAPAARPASPASAAPAVPRAPDAVPSAVTRAPAAPTPAAPTPAAVPSGAAPAPPHRLVPPIPRRERRASGPFQEVMGGSWTAERSRDALTIRVSLERPRPDLRSTLRLSEAERQRVESALGNRPLEFELERAAGTFHFQGDASGDGAEGTFDFAANMDYVDGLRERGYDLEETDIFLFATVNVPLSYVDDLAEAGYANMAVEELVAFVIHRVTPEYIAAMQRAGYDTPAPDLLVALRIHDVTPEFAAGLQAAGYRDIQAEQLIAFRIHGVTAEQAEAMAEAMGAPLDAEQLVAARIHDVDPAYLRRMASEGVRPSSFDEVVALRIHDVDPAFVARARALGLGDLSIDALVAMRIHGISADFIADVKARGFEQLSQEDLVAMRIHGVAPEMISEVKALGYDDVTIDELVAMRIHGVTPQMIRRAQEQRGRDVSIEEVIEDLIDGRK